LLSHLLPEEFPFHPNWKFGAGHPWYWDLYPTVDHVVPVTMQGPDSPDNWVTTSMRRNLIKSNRSLKELEWPLMPAGDLSVWDGLLPWYLRYLSSHPEHLQLASLRGWFRAATCFHAKLTST
jgi:hypothetical protein